MAGNAVPPGLLLTPAWTVVGLGLRGNALSLRLEVVANRKHFPRSLPMRGPERT